MAVGYNSSAAAKDISSLYNAIMGTQPLESVMLVDDDVFLCKYLENYFLKNGINFKTCKNIENAVEKLKYFLPDTLLLDLGLPDGNGFSLLKYIRQKPWGHKLPIFIYTCSTDPKLDRAVEEFENCTLIRKPVSPDKLLETIERSYTEK